MRSTATRLAVWGCGALLALGTAAATPAAADDAIVINAFQTIQVGGLALEPGAYLLRAPSSISTRNVVTVTSPDGKRFYGFVLVIHESGAHMISPVSNVFVSDDGRALERWVVAWKDTGYTFSPAPVPPALSARARAASPHLTAAR